MTSWLGWVLRRARASTGLLLTLLALVTATTAILAGADVAVDRARDVLRRADGHRGHIFNLGHGVMPESDPDVLKRVIDTVHAEGKVR